MVTLTPTIIREDGQEKFVVLPWAEFVKLREALEDAEDLRLIEEAKREDEESGEPHLTLEEVRQRLGITEDPSEDESEVTRDER